MGATWGEAFAKASEILAWPDDWDGEGSPGYRADTLDRAALFTVPFTATDDCPVPKVWAGPDGSVDVAWRGEREMLLNIPANRAEPVSFYGQDAGSEVKGESAADTAPDWLCLWLARKGQS